MRVKRLIVIVLEKSCALTHLFSTRHWPAYWSGLLDGYWDAGVWDHLVPEEDNV